jgi:16S rRNA (uracil1498-N3)-methyltransferase
VVLYRLQEDHFVRRFFVQPELLRQQCATLSSELSRHIATVLRLKSGELLLLADGCGHEAVAAISAVEKDGVVVTVQPCYPVPVDTGTPPITLCQGLPKGEKLDLILQKATELGASRIVPFTAERSVARLDGDRLSKRVQRWEKIVQEAARQSQRGSVPSVGFYGDFGKMLHGEAGELKLLLWEGEKEQGLRTLIERIDKPESVSIIIGPEGGLSDSEAAQAEQAGYIPANLGGRILRTETAGLAVISILQYAWGDLG